MTAKEMFEKMGYKAQITPKRIKYTHGGHVIVFYLGARYMSCHYREYSVLLLRAITKQCEELGWLDD